MKKRLIVLTFLTVLTGVLAAVVLTWERPTEDAFPDDDDEIA